MYIQLPLILAQQHLEWPLVGQGGCNGNVYKTILYTNRQTTYNQDFIYCASSVPYTATVSGLVSNLGSNTVRVYWDTLGGNAFINLFSQQVSSSSNRYHFSITIYNNPQTIWVYMVDCKNDTITKKLTLQTTRANLVENFNYCSSGAKYSTVSGMVYSGNSMAMSGTVLLISLKKGVLKAVDTANIQRGYYSFRIQDSTQVHLVKAYLNKGDSGYAVNLPTYGDSSLYWNGGKKIPPAYNKQFTRDIWLKSGKNKGGPGFIGGKISKGANKRTAAGDPYANGLVMLTKNGEAVQYTYSDANGGFSFSNLEYGTYNVYTELIGLPTSSLDVTISSDEEKVDNVVVTVNSSGVTTTRASTSISELEDNINVAVYPNPFNEEIKIDLTPINGPVKISVTDLSGREIAKVVKGGGRIISLDTENYLNGTYVITLQTEDSMQFLKVIK